MCVCTSTSVEPSAGHVVHSDRELLQLADTAVQFLEQWDQTQLGGRMLHVCECVSESKCVCACCVSVTVCVCVCAHPICKGCILLLSKNET